MDKNWLDSASDVVETKSSAPSKSWLDEQSDLAEPSALRSAGDSAVALGTGVIQGVKMLSDIAGADNAVSRKLGDAAQSVDDLTSPFRKAERQERARKIREAEASGSTWEEVKANVGAFAEAPLDTTLNALGTSAPTIGSAMLTGGASLPAQIAARAAPALMGAAQGVGAIKGSVFEAVKQKHMDAGLSEADAEQRASQAQAYDGDNLGSIALGGVMGAVAGSTGAEKALSRVVGNKIANSAANAGVLKSAAIGVAKEAPVEALQGGQERVASNLALQGEGFDTPTFQGAVGQAALEGLASAPIGGGFGAMEAMSGRQSQTKNSAPPAQSAGAQAFAAGQPMTPPADIKSVVAKAEWVRDWQDAAAASMTTAPGAAGQGDAVTPSGDVLPEVPGGMAGLQRTFDPRAGGKPPISMLQTDAGGNAIDFEASPEFDRSPREFQSLKENEPTRALGFNPLAGTPRVFPDGTVSLGSDQDEFTKFIPSRATQIKRSEQMGLNPAAGPMSTAAATAVDSGASDRVQQQAALTQAAEAAAKAPKGKAAEQATQAPAQRLAHRVTGTLDGAPFRTMVMAATPEEAIAAASQAAPGMVAKSAEPVSEAARQARATPSATPTATPSATPGEPANGTTPAQAIQAAPQGQAAQPAPANLKTPRGILAKKAEADAARAARTANDQAIKPAAATDSGAVAPPAAGRAGVSGVDEQGAVQALNSEWQQFPDQTGTLNVPRAEMPQVKNAHRGPMVNFLNARGVTHEQVEVDPATLKPTQSEFSQTKVQEAVDRDTDRSILISADGYVIDGHHQAIAKLQNGKPVRAIRLNATAEELLPLVREFPSSTTEKSNVQDTQSRPAGAEAQTTPVEAPAPAGGNAAAAAGVPAATGAGDVQADGVKPRGVLAKLADQKTKAARRKSEDIRDSRWESMNLSERERVAEAIGRKGIFAQKLAEKRWDRIDAEVKTKLREVLDAQKPAAAPTGNAGNDSAAQPQPKQETTAKAPPAEPVKPEPAPQPKVEKPQDAQKTKPGSIELSNQRRGEDAPAAESVAVQSAIEGKSLVEAAQFVADTGPAAQREVAAMVVKKLQAMQEAGVKLELKVAHRGEQVPQDLIFSRGYTEIDMDEKGRDVVVWLNGADVKSKVGTDYETLLHELVHAATAGAMRHAVLVKDSPYGDALKSLDAAAQAIGDHITSRFEQADAGDIELTEFEQDIRAQANNAFTSLDEVVSWALTSREAQEYLDGIPYKSGSLWTRFVRAVRSALGLPSDADTVLSEVLRASEKLMNPQDEGTRFMRAFWHKRGIMVGTQQAKGSVILINRNFARGPATESTTGKTTANPGDESNYGTKDQSQGTPADLAVMDMAGEGKSADEILRFIANASKSPFNRQIANLLRRTKANPAVSIGGDMGGGAGFKFLAKYSRKNHEVTLSEGASGKAEQILLHEMVHAATLLALDRGGEHAARMKALYESVKAQGLADAYGMKNVGEFVAEAFTNPEFQKALKGYKAPGGTAWDRFVAAVRRILGLSDQSQDALSAALELGVEVMRENVPLRKARSFSAEDAPEYFGMADAASLKNSALDQIHKTLSHPGKVSIWDRTIGTMRNLSERSKEFKPVFEAAQRFLDDVSMLGNEAADAAPRLLPRVESWRDLTKKPVSAEDNKAISKPIFEGTLMWARDTDGKPVLVDDMAKKYADLSTGKKSKMLMAAGRLDDRVLRMWQGLPSDQFDALVNSRFESQMLKAGVVWKDAELKSLFNLNDNQISLYREARQAIDRSIDLTARADMLRAVGTGYAGMRDAVLELPTLADARDLLVETLHADALDNEDQADRLMGMVNTIADRFEKATELSASGYAPLSRFGRYTLDVVDAAGERQYFGLYESMRDANLAKIQMAGAFPGSTITQGTMSAEAYKLFAGITPESLELFGNMLGLDAEGGDARDKAFQEYLKLSKNNHSALKRLMHRKGIAGYSEDVGRVLASFVYSNARQAAGGLNAGTIEEAVNAIPKDQGELKDVAMGLRDYVRDPQEEGQAIRGMLFAQYLGGSLASAFVNTTQPFAVTLPWLSQFGGMKVAGKHLAKALKDMAGKGAYEADLKTALDRAEEDGVVSPQEIHALMAQARGAGGLRSGDGTRAGNARAAASNAWERTKVAWGQPFALAEQFNRRSTFIAAYRLAKERGMQSPAEFARKAVLETQFLYSKANKMRWGRGAVGGTLMTFKTYSVSYLELLNRMWTQGGPEGKRAVGWAMVMLMLMGGAGGLPFLEDLEDLIDGIAQMMGYNLSAKRWRQEAIAQIVGKELGEFVNSGLSGLPGAPIDVSGRLGMGDLIPGTGLFLTKQNRERDLMEIVGPAGDLVSRGFKGARKALTGDIGGAALELSPTAVRNAAKGIDMAASGMYKDTKGYKVMDTTLAEAAAKFAGFQPRSVAKDSEATGFKLRTKSYYIQQSSEIKAQWADALFRKDEGALQDVRDRLADWNRKNPDLPIVVKMPDVWKRVREMGKDRTQRIADTAPKALRQEMRELARDN